MSNLTMLFAAFLIVAPPTLRAQRPAGEQLLAFSQVVGDRAFFGFYGVELTPVDAPPGSCRVTLHVNGRSHTGSTTIRNDPLVDKN